MPPRKKKEPKLYIITLEEVWERIGPPVESEEWWTNALKWFGYYIIQNPHDKLAANAYSKLVYGSMGFNALNKSLKDQYELDELKARVEDIFKARDKERII